MRAAQAETHTVSPGETLSYIADAYGVTVGHLVDANSLPDPDVIFPGEVLHIPGFSSGEDTFPAAATTGYTVESGDTLSGIAALFGVTLGKMMTTNAIEDPDFLRIGQILAIPQPATSAAPEVFDVRPDDPEMEALLDQMAYEQGIDPGLVKALAYVESTWDQRALSPAGAIGVMQVMPDTARWLEDDVFGFQLNEEDSAYDNITMGTVFLRILLDETGWDTQAAVASYYQGLAPTQAGVLFEGSQGYVDRVLAIRAQFWP